MLSHSNPNEGNAQPSHTKKPKPSFLSDYKGHTATYEISESCSEIPKVEHLAMIQTKF